MCYPPFLGWVGMKGGVQEETCVSTIAAASCIDAPRIHEVILQTVGAGECD